MPETWKDTKREYLLMLIRDGDLSNSNLDDIIACVQHMIRRHNKYLPVPSTVEDMRRIVEACNPSYALIPDGMAHEQAVKHLEHGPERVELMDYLNDCIKHKFPIHTNHVQGILKKAEGK